MPKKPSKIFFWTSDWEFLESSHDREIDWSGKLKAIRINRYPHLGRSGRDWPRYCEALTNLMILIGRGAPGLTCSRDSQGRVDWIFRNPKLAPKLA